MLSELKRLNANDPRFKTVDIGIGIATGEAIAGNFGGANRFDYSVIGDTVNLASRLEELTRKFKSHLLVSRETLTQAVGGNYIKRDIGQVRVKGKQRRGAGRRDRRARERWRRSRVLQSLRASHRALARTARLTRRAPS